MGHELAINALKRYTKVETQNVATLDFVAALRAESDRGAVILAGSMIDDMLTQALKDRMPLINSEEKNRIFAFEGIAATFSSRVKLAQAMGIINRGSRHLIDLIREMRNACAHSRQPINFTTPVLYQALCSAMPGIATDARNREKSFPRGMFYLMCGVLADSINGEVGPDNSTNLAAMVVTLGGTIPPSVWLDKPLE